MILQKLFTNVGENSPSLRFVLPMFLFLFIFCMLFGMYVDESLCSHIENSFTCSDKIGIVAALAPFVILIGIYGIASMKKYQIFQSSPKIRRLTLILEIIFTPIIGLAFFFITFVLSAATGQSENTTLHYSLGGIILLICLGIIRNIFLRWSGLKGLEGVINPTHVPTQEIDKNQR